MRGRGAAAGEARRVAGITHRQIGQETHPHGVVVAAGEERGASRRTQRGHVETVVAEPPVGQPVDGRGGNVRAEAAQLGEAGVVEDDGHHVGGARRRLGLGGVDRGHSDTVRPSRRSGVMAFLQPRTQRGTAANSASSQATWTGRVGSPRPENLHLALGRAGDLQPAVRGVFDEGDHPRAPRRNRPRSWTRGSRCCGSGRGRRPRPSRRWSAPSLWPWPQGIGHRAFAVPRVLGRPRHERVRVVS